MTVEFAYDHNGLRTQKKVTQGSTVMTTDYQLHGKWITHMKQVSNELHFFYDGNGRPAMVKYSGALYTYVHNLQGDIVAILDSAGAKVVEYKYDAWGKPLSTTGSAASSLGKLNPFRYRGYVYDEETAFYYLRSRYYISRWGRFVNADAIITKRLHAFAYCDDNPINAIDSNGCRPTYDVRDPNRKPPTQEELISDSLDRIEERTGIRIDYGNYGAGRMSYQSTLGRVSKNNSEIVSAEFFEYAIAYLMGALGTVLTENKYVGGVIGIVQTCIFKGISEYETSIKPKIPDGIYRHEIITYTEEVAGFLGYTYCRSCHYINGIDDTGCTYYALWEEEYTISLTGTTYVI